MSGPNIFSVATTLLSDRTVQQEVVLYDFHEAFCVWATDHFLNFMSQGSTRVFVVGVARLVICHGHNQQSTVPRLSCIQVVQAMFRLSESMLCTIIFVYNELIGGSTVKGDSVPFLDLCQRENVRDPLFMVPYCAITREVPNVVGTRDACITVNVHEHVDLSYVLEELWIVEDING